MMLTRSASASTSARMWLDSSTVRPSSRARRTCSVKTTSMSGSSPEVGSSRTSSSAREARAATRATFCRLPLEYARAFLVGSRAKASSSCARRAGSTSPRSRASRSIVSPPVRPGPQRDVARHVGQPPVQARPRRPTGRRRAARCAPASGRSRPSRTRIAVDLPEPFGPSSPWTSPCPTDRSRPSSARVAPKVLTTPVMATTSAMGRRYAREAAVSALCPDARRPRRSRVTGPSPHPVGEDGACASSPATSTARSSPGSAR